MANEEQYFWSRVDMSAGPTACWPWVGTRDPKGYGRFCHNGVRTRAHRVAFRLAHGSVPSGLSVCHHCDNPPCCNDSHLFVGTNADNVADRHAKGRSRGPSFNAHASHISPEIVRGENNGNSKLTWSDVEGIRSQRAQGASLNKLALTFGVSRSNIRFIVTGSTWRIT